MRPQLIVMARAPRLGRVKTRLAREIGAAEALRAYRTMLDVIKRAVIRPQRWRTLLALDPAPARRAAPRLAPGRPALIRQGRGDLGQRLARLARAIPGPLVFIGSDCPHVRAHHIARAFQALKAHDAVLGPAPDGGYWLIGLRAGFRPARLFSNVRWSSRHARADTLANLASARVILLETLADIDTKRDLHAWQAVRT